jgi:DNA-binding CsgD family transcriptional regulator
MARDGLSNPEIGGRLFVSARIFRYHLKRSSSNSASNRAISSRVD